MHILILIIYFNCHYFSVYLGFSVILFYAFYFLVIYIFAQDFSMYLGPL